MAKEKVVIKTFVAAFKISTKGFGDGVKALGRQVAKLGKSMSNAFKPSFWAKVGRGIYQALAWAFEKVVQIVKDFQEQVIGVADASRKLGISTDYISRLGNAMELVGGSTDDAISLVETLQSGLNDLKFGEGNLLEASKKWGLRLHDANGQLLTMPAMLAEIERRMSSMTAQDAMALGNMLGLSDEQMRLLRSGKRSQFMKDAGAVITEEDARRAERIREATARMKQNMRGMALNLQRMIVPFADEALQVLSTIPKLFAEGLTTSGIDRAIKKYFGPILKGYERTMGRLARAFRGLKLDFNDTQGTVNSFKKLFTAIGDHIKETMKNWGNLFAGIFDKIRENSPKWAKQIGLGLKEAFTTLIERSPEITGAIGAKLGDLIGNLIKGVFALGKVGLDFARAFLSGLIEGIENMDILEAIPVLAKKLLTLIKMAVFTALENLYSFFVNLIGHIISTFSGEMGAKFFKKFLPEENEGKQKLNELVSKDNPELHSLMSQQSGGGNISPTTPANTNNINNANVTVNNNNNITVSGANKNPRQVGNEIGRGINRTTDSSLSRETISQSMQGN